MDQHIQAVMEVKLEKTKKALEDNRFEVYIVNDEHETKELLHKLIPSKAVCSLGGSQTLIEMGVLDELRIMDICLQDRYAENADVQKIFRDAFYSDFYITSSNAITQMGELYNIDGTGNRVAAMTFGPQNVIVIAGQNKIVKDMVEAERRLQEIACPSNAMRLNRGTPCLQVGYCVNCRHEKRICSTFVKTARSHVPNRIKVILVKKEFGY